MIKSFRHKGVEQFFKTGSKAKIQPKHADKLKLQRPRWITPIREGHERTQLEAASLARRSERPLVGGCQRQLAADV
jgi:plasmid maintenance system killer protein